MTAPQGKTSAKAGPGEAVAARADARRHQQAGAERAAGFSDMQCAAGNLAIQQLFRSGAIQAKLTISQPDDGEEREADHAAEHVLAVPAAGRAGGNAVGGTGLRADLMAARPAIRRRAAAGGGSDTARRSIEGAPGSGGGRPLDDAPRSFMEARFGRDFAGVRIHTDDEAAASARALNARAYTHGRDIVFARGEYLPESGEGRRLLAHELAHVVQQDQEARPTVIWRQTADAPTPSPTPGATPPPPTATAGGQPTADHPAGLIVEDSTQDLAPGQMKRGQFLSQLRTAVYSTAEQAVASSPMAAVIRPQMNQEIERQFGLYSGLDARSLENTIRQRVPGAAGVAAASAFIPLICEQVRQTIAAKLPNEAGQVGVAGSVLGAVGAMAQGVGDVVASVGDILFKAREGGPRRPDGLHAIRVQLGPGHALDGGLRSGMGAAFGHDFSGVRVHTDADAARLADKLNARAFTYGQDIAFGTGEYRPGTLIGDALIAHELAHVVQQRGAGSAPAPASTDPASEKAFESDADTAAVGAMISLWARAQGGMVKIAQNAVPALRSGLRLRPITCPWDEPSPVPTPPSATPTSVPEPPPPEPQPLRDELAQRKITRQAAVDRGAAHMGVDGKLLEGGKMFYSANVPPGDFGFTATPAGYKRNKPTQDIENRINSDTSAEQTLNMGKNKKPLVTIGPICFDAIGWTTLFATIRHEWQHVLQIKHQDTIEPLPIGEQIKAKQEQEAHCEDIIAASKFIEEGKIPANEKETVKKEIENSWKTMNTTWFIPISILKGDPKLQALRGRAIAAAAKVDVVLR